MPFLQSNIPHFKCWVRREYTVNHERYHGEFLHAMAIAVTTMPNRCLSFQLIFTGCEVDEEGGENVHGGAMWARMPITALVADEQIGRASCRERVEGAGGGGGCKKRTWER